MNTKTLILYISLVLMACGGGSNSNPSNQKTSDLKLQGTIVFEQAYSYGFIEHQGIMAFDLSSNQMQFFADGIFPRRHTKGDKTVFLQYCFTSDSLTSQGDYYKVVVADSRGLFTPITPCSHELVNPTTNVFVWDDLTSFGFVNMSPDQLLVAVSEYYDVLNANQTDSIGEAWNTRVYDATGNSLTEPVKVIYNAWDADWLPDGRLLFVNDNGFYITDKQLNNPTHIDDGGLLQAKVSVPAVHPSGEYFVFVYNHQIWRMDIDGANLEQVLYSDKRLRYPAWSPDGTTLVFTQWDLDWARADKTLYFLNIETKEQHSINIEHVLTSSGEPWGPLSWVN